MARISSLSSQATLVFTLEPNPGPYNLSMMYIRTCYEIESLYIATRVQIDRYAVR
ncbi:hypothetical protein Hanom_Chr03g00276581 [Helianthus anomalus]